MKIAGPESRSESTKMTLYQSANFFWGGVVGLPTLLIPYDYRGHAWPRKTGEGVKIANIVKIVIFGALVFNIVALWFRRSDLDQSKISKMQEYLH